MGIGISSSVSSQANPIIIPWSPAPVASSGSVSPCLASADRSTPRAMSGDCSWIATITPHVAPSIPNVASV